MTTKTGFKILPTILVVAGLFVAAYILFPSLQQTNDEHGDDVTVIVNFSPSPRTGGAGRPGGALKDVVTIQLTVGRNMVPNDAATSAPWVRTFPRTRGDRVTLWAEQFFGDELQCAIRHRSQTVSYDEGKGPSTVRCIYTVK